MKGRKRIDDINIRYYKFLKQELKAEGHRSYDLWPSAFNSLFSRSSMLYTFP